MNIRKVPIHARRMIAVASCVVFLSADSLVAVADGQTPFNAPETSLQDLPESGHRYAALGSGERAALRRGFRLPMNALFTASSTAQLTEAAIVAPLPDPEKPFLPMTPGSDPAGGDPFGDEATSVNPLGALGRLFAIEARLAADSGSRSASSESIPEAISANDPFGNPGPSAAAEEPAGDDGDPFASAPVQDDDPFASDSADDDDPFGF